ncbi:MAG: ATP-binding protein [Treponema sp.]|nr:ATP-binding protein [Treponema sp.]MCL2236968.1 ATP-binding protein [Treponema sp.]
MITFTTLLLSAVILILVFLLFKTIVEKRIANEHAKIMLDNLQEERKNFEATAHWYKSILDAVPLPITVTDANACWTFVNTRVEEFLGKNSKSLIGKPCSNWGASICNTPNCGIECAKAGIKHTFFTYNGASYKVDVEILKDISGETAGYIEVVQDVTQLEEISKRQMDTELISKAKSSFIATVSHEIRTPLNAIMGVTDIQIQDQGISQRTKEALIQIHNSSDLLLQIINDILDYSKIEAGQLQLVPYDYDVPSLINDAVHLNIVRINNKPIEFELHADENIPSLLFGDELRIKQILNNILSNAFKYTKKGKVTLTINAEYKNLYEDDNITIVFVISDTGQGMTHDEIANIFNEYTRFQPETNRTTEGTGLGMSITKHLIRLMNGEIYVDSVLGKGTTFTIRLPQKNAKGEKIGKEVADRLQRFHYDNSPLLKNLQIVREPMPYGNVLIVDDVETNLYVARGLMAPYDLKIDLASSGYETIEKINKGNMYDLIFMDHMMPKMDGMETVKIIRESGYPHPIVALTANAVVGQAEIFLKNGFNDFIPKPIDLRQLNSILIKYIRDKQPAEVIEKAQREKAEKKKQEAVLKPTDNELAEIFTRDAKKIITTLNALMSNHFHDKDDIHNYIVNVHSIKSALANVGEAELSYLAAKLEKYGRDNNIEDINEETPDFLASLQKVINKFRPADEEAITEDSEESLAYLQKKLAVVKAACREYNKSAVKTAIHELREKSWSNKTKETLSRISEHLLHSEFDEIYAFIEEFESGQYLMSASL